MAKVLQFSSLDFCQKTTLQIKKSVKSIKPLIICIRMPQTLNLQQFSVTLIFKPRLQDTCFFAVVLLQTLFRYTGLHVGLISSVLGISF